MPKRDLEDYQRRAVLAKKGMSQKATFTLPEGKTTFRILNTPSDEERNSPAVWIEYFQHYNIGPKKFRQRCGIDPVDESGECWGCKQVEKEIDKGNSKLAKDMERKKVFEVQAAIWDDDLGGLRGPVRWPVSGTSAKSLAYMLMTICASEKAKKWLSHKTGYNFTIERSGMKMTDTNYTSPDKDDDPSEVPVEIVRKLKSFADVIPAYDEAAFKRAYYGQDDEDEGEEKMAVRKRRVEEEEEEEVVRPKRKIRDEEDEQLPDEDDDDPRPKKKKVKVVEEDEDEDVEFGEEEEEEVKPKKKKVVQVEEDEEEEPAPKPKKKVKVVEEEEDEEEEEPVSRPKRKVVVDDDEEEEVVVRPKRKVVVEDEDEEEEPAPKPKKKVKVVEEEDEDLALEDEEEEVKPKKRPVRVVDEDEDEEEVEEEEKPRRRR